MEGVYPDGLQRHELFASSLSGLKVQLTDDPSVQPEAINYASPNIRWACASGKADGMVTYVGRRWGKDAAGQDVCEVGLFGALLDPDALGSPDFRSAAPVLLPLEMDIWEEDGWGSSAAFPTTGRRTARRSSTLAAGRDST